MKTMMNTIKLALIALGMAAFATIAQAEYTDDCITFSSAASFTLKATKEWDGTLWTSTDKTNWTEWNGASITAGLTGGTYHLYVRGNAANMKITAGCQWGLTGGAGIACTGNIETLRGATGNNPSPTTMTNFCYSDMFSGCKLLTEAPALPATTLAYCCYSFLFYNCTSLTNAPALPATTLAVGCYSSMFYGCTALTSTPTLPATTLAGDCYAHMFTFCESLTSAPDLPATTLADFCYYYMFLGCSSLTDAPALPVRTLVDYCYSHMFDRCTALKEAPTLPATTLTVCCYEGMFSGCTSLKAAPALPATTLASYCYYKMFSDCSALTNAPVLPATTLEKYCYNGMFQGCLALTNTPALPAMEMSERCYENMFSGCKLLTNAPVLPATTLANYCYCQMFYRCASLKDAPGLPVTTLEDGCYYEMFWGCTALKDAPALPATKLANRCCYKMFYNCTALKVNTSAPGKEWKIPATSTTETDWGYDMFVGTKGTLRGQPKLNTTYYIASAPQEPIEPGGEIVVPEGKAEEKAAEINNDPAVKAQYLKAPGGIETTAEYLGCFDAVATSGSTVAFVLNENGTNEVVEATEEVKTAALDTVFSEESTMTIDKPLVGFYYSLRQGGDVSVGDQADLNKLGGRDTISFELTKSPFQYFYQTIITPIQLPEAK